MPKMWEEPHSGSQTPKAWQAGNIKHCEQAAEKIERWGTTNWRKDFFWIWLMTNKTDNENKPHMNQKNDTGHQQEVQQEDDPELNKGDL